MKRWLSPLLLMLCLAGGAEAATLGPAASGEDVASLFSTAADGDVLMIYGDVDMAGFPLIGGAQVRFQSADSRATLRGLQASDVQLTFSQIDLADSLVVTGHSSISMQRGARVFGSPGQPALSFSGSGALITEPGSECTGGSEAPGLAISHAGGDFYVGLEGIIQGGDGEQGGAGVTISPLRQNGVLLLSGQIAGGRGSAVGGCAVDLFNLLGNAYITITAQCEGGAGPVGGNGVQIVSATENACVGINADIFGGNGESYGGSALMLMNLDGSSSVLLGGSLNGGAGKQPGQPVVVADNGSVAHAIVFDCLLQPGEQR